METTCRNRHRRKTVLHRKCKNKYDKSELSARISDRDVSLAKPRIKVEDNVNNNANDVLRDAEHTLYQGVLFSQNVNRIHETRLIVI
jgi:hypothetical protein